MYRIRFKLFDWPAITPLQLASSHSTIANGPQSLCPPCSICIGPLACTAALLLSTIDISYLSTTSFLMILFANWIALKFFPQILFETSSNSSPIQLWWPPSFIILKYFINANQFLYTNHLIPSSLPLLMPRF